VLFDRGVERIHVDVQDGARHGGGAPLTATWRP
jgi:hypothetical protein